MWAALMAFPKVSVLRLHVAVECSRDDEVAKRLEFSVVLAIRRVSKHGFDESGSFFSTLRKGWLRHGLAEIIKMGVVKDRVLFECMEKGGYRLIETMFGNSPDCQDDTEFQALCDLIISRALDSYVQSEYGNLWECHQCRPHAYGHIWSPGFELPAGMLHGHAIAIGMGFGAYLSFQLGWIPEGEFRRVLNLFSTLELSLVHPILENTEAIWQAQVRMIEKHGGNLAAPLPKEQIGSCGYFNDITREELEKYLAQYRSICETYPRRGLGVEAHCTDVGLEDPREL
jgi:3-dehydroquinate synthase